MKTGIEGSCCGANPRRGQNAGCRRGAGQLKWMVCCDLFETETAAFWKREGVDPRHRNRIFFMPVAARREGRSFTNTMRLVQITRSVDPPNDAKSDLRS